MIGTTATVGDASQTDTRVRRPTVRLFRERPLFLLGERRPEHREGILELAVAVLKDGGDRAEDHEKRRVGGVYGLRVRPVSVAGGDGTAVVADVDCGGSQPIKQLWALSR